MSSARDDKNRTAKRIYFLGVGKPASFNIKSTNTYCLVHVFSKRGGDSWEAKFSSPCFSIWDFWPIVQCRCRPNSWKKKSGANNDFSVGGKPRRPILAGFSMHIHKKVQRWKNWYVFKSTKKWSLKIKCSSHEIILDFGTWQNYPLAYYVGRLHTILHPRRSLFGGRLIGPASLACGSAR